MGNKVDGALFARMIRQGAENLRNNRETVNDLNVFPVPDGDTGDNMFMTIHSGAEAAGDGQGSLDEVSGKVARGMLLGARGNSGVILSRIFSGISKGLTGVEEADVQTLAEAFASGISESYGAVSVPVEGTILSVYRDAVQYAGSRVKEDSTLESFFADMIPELHASLDRTPELLDALKQAGVVDSGGAGFTFIAEGMEKAILGEEVSETGAAAPLPSGASPKQINLDLFTSDSELEFGYCTEFLLRLQNRKVDVEHFDVGIIRTYLESIGDSIVCFQDGSIVKVHVHTKTPGVILNHMQEYGEFLTLKIENMTIQHSEREEKMEDKKPVSSISKAVRPHKKYGIVTVASGEGVKKMFEELGADEVIEGGQSMNPSAESFMKAFENLNVDHILVFPNNSNIILTARQAAALFERVPVEIIPTKSIGDGCSAISMLDTELAPEEIVQAAMDSIEGVVTGCVSVATRDTEMNGVSVHAGDYIGFEDDTVCTDQKLRRDAALDLMKALDAGDHDIITLIVGQAVPEQEGQELLETLEEQYPQTEFNAINGGQPIYDYMFVLE